MRKTFTIISIAAVLISSCSGPDRAFMAEDWERVIAEYADDGENVYYDRIARLNLALAQKGELAEKAFTYTQAGSAGLLPEWSPDGENGALLSDIYFAMGYVSLSQRMAFETDVLAPEGHNPAMLARLVQTNLIFGAYKVAEKYIIELEKDPATRAWAQSQRRFLSNDAAIENDPLLSSMRRCIPEENFTSGELGLTDALRAIIKTNPKHRQAIEYLGTLYLLDMDFEAFRAFLDEFYGTEALPELPRAFSEAACMLSEMEHGYWKTVGVSQETYRNFRDFVKRLGTGLSMDRFEDTYFYYVMRANSQ